MGALEEAKKPRPTRTPHDSHSSLAVPAPTNTLIILSVPLPPPHTPHRVAASQGIVACYVHNAAGPLMGQAGALVGIRTDAAGDKLAQVRINGM